MSEVPLYQHSHHSRPITAGTETYRVRPLNRRRATDSTVTYHAGVFDGVAKSHFLLKAVVFKSQKRVLTRF
jgi:hypothetical protein